MIDDVPVKVNVKVFEKGQLKAFVDITVCFGDHEITLLGYRVIQNGDQQPWIASPTSSYQKDGKSVNKKIVELSRKLDQIIKTKILVAYASERGSETQWDDSLDELLKTT